MDYIRRGKGGADDNEGSGRAVSIRWARESPWIGHGGRDALRWVGGMLAETTPDAGQRERSEVGGRTARVMEKEIAFQTRPVHESFKGPVN